ncbi:DUF6204 family protein [Quadrisphaera oryzae]|uniref:DUF6204 family protein n=1 Tax=Quadrisphaera TaxID=317661 RepID=UPI00164771D5|nr:DUF6204 family protein [Quadrisphaera sp. RL12-1S]MBC3761135.1 hypothetical protein [Quadrisphaera sp. RL12-1S]
MTTDQRPRDAASPRIPADPLAPATPAAPATSQTRTYRTEVVGQFDRPSGELRQRLLAAQGEHDVFSSAFTEDGCWTYGPTLTRFTVRHLLTVVSPSTVEANDDARTEALLRTMTILQDAGVSWRGDLSVSVTCLQDVRTRASKRTGRRSSS